MRARLMAHPEYKADSEVSAGMTYDLLRACSEVTARAWLRARVTGRVRVRVRVRVRAKVRLRVGARVRPCTPNPNQVSEGRQSAPDLLGQHWVRPLKVEHAWYTPLTSVGKQDYSALLARYVRQVRLRG